jgi:Icc-related predicted phosphoesterase
MRIVAFSDTHGQHSWLKLPDGDVLICAGDFMTDGYSFKQLARFADWFSDQPHKLKIWIAGNHDRLVEMDRQLCVSRFSHECKYLQDSGLTYEGVNFYGSPWTPEFNNWAFNLPLGNRLHQVWDAIPDSTDVLITHGPPKGILDKMSNNILATGLSSHLVGESASLGCDDLRKRVFVVKPKLHIFGHIHGGHGLDWGTGTTFANVSVVDEGYSLVHPATQLNLEV